MTYVVELHDLARQIYACECADFRKNGLGTCKHIEAVLLQVERRFKKPFGEARKNGTQRVSLLIDATQARLRFEGPWRTLSSFEGGTVAPDGALIASNLAEAIDSLGKLKGTKVRIAREVARWQLEQQHAEERKILRRHYEQRVQSGEWPAQETNVPLFPYQREGMIHLAFTERALLADEMGLGKTIQAIAACALLHRLGKAKRVLVVTPASLKTEWEEQIRRFTQLPLQLVFGARRLRLAAYSSAPFFTVVNYEQMLGDALEVNQLLKPDIVVLDEAQRIKNWDTKTAQAIKRLESRYAFVLTGTPIENRIDELYSIVDFLQPGLLGPLFRFNREFYQLDGSGKPCGLKNLRALHERVKPLMLRRLKSEVETELPERTDLNYFVKMSPAQLAPYQEHSDQVARLMRLTTRRTLLKAELDKLMRELAMMRMLCDTPYILDSEDRTCPKLDELKTILEEHMSSPDSKMIIFSEWERMLHLVRDLCQSLGLGFSWHTGSVPQRKRRTEITLFKTDPSCRVFLTTDAGSTGLNLQNASVVVNCDLPWNPAKLEQRIARAWRKNQTRPVTVVNLISEETIEQRMLTTLAVKRALADGVLDLKGDLDQLKLSGGRQAFLEKLSQFVSAPAPVTVPVPPPKPQLPSDRAAYFAEKIATELGRSMVRCEEQFPENAEHSVIVVVVDRDVATYSPCVQRFHEELFKDTDPLAPTRLEVLDRATHEALERLIQLGVVTRNVRAARPLFPAVASASAPALSAEQLAQASAHRTAATRKLKMAALLHEGGLEEEAVQCALDSVLPAARALAIERRVPEPTTNADTIRPPTASVFGEHIAALRAFLESPSSQTLTAALPRLQQLLGSS